MNTLRMLIVGSRQMPSALHIPWNIYFILLTLVPFISHSLLITLWLQLYLKIETALTKATAILLIPTLNDHWSLLILPEHLLHFWHYSSLFLLPQHSAFHFLYASKITLLSILFWSFLFSCCISQRSCRIQSCKMEWANWMEIGFNIEILEKLEKSTGEMDRIVKKERQIINSQNYVPLLSSSKRAVVLAAECGMQ